MDQLLVITAKPVSNQIISPTDCHEHFFKCNQLSNIILVNCEVSGKLCTVYVQTEI
jgi:hypothetical protein